MAGLSDKVKSIVGFLTQGFEGNSDDPFVDLVDELNEHQVDGQYALKEDYISAPIRNNKENVIAHPNYRGHEVLVCEPRSYEECVQIVKHLKERKTIILNLHLLDKEQSMRIVDFICGATHALSGNQQKIGESVFIFTPNNIALTAESQKSKFIRDALWNQPQ